MAVDEEGIFQTYNDYVQAFHALNPRALLSCSHVPCMRLSAHGVPIVAFLAEVETHFTQTFDVLKARDDAWSAIREVCVKTLNDNIALLSMCGVRYRNN